MNPSEDDEFEPLVLSQNPEEVPSRGAQTTAPRLLPRTGEQWGTDGYIEKSSSGPGGRSGSGLIVLQTKGSPYMRPGAARKGELYPWTSPSGSQQPHGLHH